MPIDRRPSAVLLLVLVAVVGCDADPPAADAGMDAGVPDAGPPWTGPGCDPVDGIECDGDWSDRCAPACDATECCSPQRGRFECVPRGADGSCPAPNLWLDETRIEGGQVAVEWRFFEEDDCAIAEGCVEAAGWRRLLRFATWTPNTGTADMYLGVPSTDAPYFVYSACHDHHHFEGYADYELRAADGTVAADGHKQAFCLLDFYRYPEEDERGIFYDCGNQGIQRDYQDVYDADLDCQWVDVTDVTPGDYTLHIELNTNRTLLESSYDDNAADVTVTIPEDVPPDVTAPCSFERYGADRDCAWAREGAYDCNPGDVVTVSCSTACGAGSCEGDTILRACAEADDPGCTGRNALATNDDSGCSADDYCSQIEFACPAGGRFVAFTGAYDTADAASTCTVAVSSAPAP